MASTTTGKRRGRPPGSKNKKKEEAFVGVTEGANDAIDTTKPYIAAVTLQGSAKILFHAYNCEYVEEKNNAKRGSAIKKEDDLDKYVYRDSNDHLALPGLNFVACVATAAKRHKDPSSARKSAHDLCKAALIPMNEFEPFHGELETWEFADKRRVVVQRAAVPRTRPGLYEGWKITFHVQVTMPDLITPTFLQTIVRDAGMFQGLGDFRPTFGRFNIVGFETIQDF